MTPSEVTIKKPLTDERQYRYLTLENGIRVLLISDPSVDKAAAACNVNVGSFQDPDEVAGTAHFCEHMLFLGSERYQQEGEYHEFVSKNGGYSNAYTDMEDTNYHFQVKKEALEEAIDRMAQFFVAPLFNASGVDREMNAVHSEHQKNIQNDSWRMFQLMKSVSNPKHPFSKFSTGDLTTLKTLPETAGMEPLDTLENWVRRSFGPCDNKNVQLPDFSSVRAYETEQLGMLYRVVPVKDLKDLSILFHIPDHPNSLYTAKPLRVFSHLLGHESDGSVFAMLKARGWATALSAGPMHQFSSQTFMTVTIKMTEAGEEHWREMVDAVFAYLNMLRTQTGIPRWVWEECRDLADIEFKFKEKTGSIGYVSHLTVNMRKYAAEHIISGDYLYEDDFNEALLRRMLDHMTADNVVVIYSSKLNESVANEQEKIYGSKFARERISDDVIAAWRSVLPREGEPLHLPPRNEFIPKNFNIKKDAANDGKIDEEGSAPELIREDDKLRVYWKLDTRFDQPKLISLYKIITPLQFSSPQSYLMSRLFSDMVKDKLNELVYLAELAGLEFDISGSGTEGLVVTIKGYNDKFSTIREKIFDIISEHSHWVSKDRFEVLKEKLLRALKNHLLDQPYQHTLLNTQAALSTKSWPLEDQILVLPEISFDVFVHFIPVLFLTLQVEALLHGNLTKDEALAEVNALEQTLCANRFGLLPSQVPFNNTVDLSESSVDFIFQQKAHNPDDANSAIEVLYQVALREKRQDLTMAIVTQILSSRYFEQLRTKEQLGYLVFSRFHVLNNVLYLSVILQSSSKSAAYLLDRSDNYMENMFLQEELSNISDEDFQQYVQSLIEERREKDKMLLTETMRHWREITTRQYDFSRREKSIEVLKTISKQEVLDFANKFLGLKSPSCRRFVSQVFAHQCADEMKGQSSQLAQEAQRRVVNISSLVEFKRQQNLFPGYSKY